MEYLAKRIQELRKEFKYSQDELANKLGISRQAISKWEREEGLPDLYNIKKLAEVFNISVDDLIQESKNEEITIQKKTNISLVLQLISMFVLIPAFLFLILTVIFGGAFLIENIVTLYRSSEVFAIYIGFTITIIYFLIKYFVMMYLNKDFYKSRIKEIIVYGIALLAYLLSLTVLSLSGFSLIFLYIVGLLILITGLVGTILYNQAIDHSISTKTFGIFKKTMKVIKYMIIIYIGLFIISNIQSSYFIVNTRYYNDYIVRTTDTEFYLRLNNTADCSDYDYFNHKIRLKVDLDNDITEPYIKIYMGDFLITEGEMSPIVEVDYNYTIFKETDNVQTPLIFTDSSITTYEDRAIRIVLTYTQNGQVITEATRMYTDVLDADAIYKNYWIWDYNKLNN